MNLSFIGTLGLSLAIMLSGCSTQLTPQFAQLDEETSDYCTQFNGVNESGNEITVSSYSIKSIESDSNGKKVKASKVVDCDA